MHQRVGRVVGAAGFALVTGGDVQGENAGVGIDEGMQFEQAFIHAAEFFRAEILVINGTANGTDLHKGEGVNGGEQLAIGNERAGKVRRGAGGVPQKTAERGQREFGTAGGGTEFLRE